MTEYSRLITSNLISSEIKLNCKKGVWIFNPFKSFSYFSFFAFSVAIAPRLTTTDDPSTDDFFECDCELNEQCRFGCLDDDQSWVESYLREIMNSQSSFCQIIHDGTNVNSRGSYSRRCHNYGPRSARHSVAAGMHPIEESAKQPKHFQYP